MPQRKNFSLLSPFFFFWTSFFLFTLGQGNTPPTYPTVSAIFWILTLLTTLLSMESTFQEAWARGLIDVWILRPLSFAQIIFLHGLQKIFYFSLPLMGVGLVLGFYYDFSTEEIFWLLAGIATGMPSLILIGLMVSCFKLGSHGGVMLMSLILFPLYVPILIFGLSIPEALLNQENPWSAMKGLLGLLLLNTLFCPLVGAWGLKQAVMR